MSMRYPDQLREARLIILESTHQKVSSDSTALKYLINLVKSKARLIFIVRARCFFAFEGLPEDWDCDLKTTPYRVFGNGSVMKDIKPGQHFKKGIHLIRKNRLIHISI